MYLKSITVSFQLASSVLSLTQIYLLTSIPLSTLDAFPLGPNLTIAQQV